MNISTYHNLRKKSRLLKFVPWVGGNTGTAIYPNVWLAAPVYDNVCGDSPDPYKWALVEHEQEHIKRMKRMGASKWYWRYAINRRFRFEEELAATVIQLRYIKNLGLTFDLDRRAKVLSGHLYLWPVGRKEARRRLNETWNKL